MRQAFVISFLMNYKSSSAARRCSSNEKSSFNWRLVLHPYYRQIWLRFGQLPGDFSLVPFSGPTLRSCHKQRNLGAFPAPESRSAHKIAWRRGYPG